MIARLTLWPMRSPSPRRRKARAKNDHATDRSDREAFEKLAGGELTDAQQTTTRPSAVNRSERNVPSQPATGLPAATATSSTKRAANSFLARARSPVTPTSTTPAV